MITEAQQLDTLWTALQNDRYWVGRTFDNLNDLSNKIGLYLESTGVDTIRTIAEFYGPTREDVITQLLAYMTAERLS